MIMIGYSSLFIVGSIELIIFAQCVTQIARWSIRRKKQNNIIQCFCLLYKYGFKSIQLPWSKRHWINQIWGDLFTSTTKFPSNDQWVMSIGVYECIQPWVIGWWVEGIGVCSLVGYSQCAILYCSVDINSERDTVYVLKAVLLDL